MTPDNTEHRAMLKSAASELDRLSEATTDLMNFVDFTDSVTFHGEEGYPSGAGFKFNYAVAYAQGLQRPSATACAYISEMQLRFLRARSRAFTMLNPYWRAVRENRIAYAVGTGHTINVVPRRKDKPLDAGLKQDIIDFLDEFQRVNQYRRRQGEKITRLDRDGEFFLRLFDDSEDGILRVHFVEPLLIVDPPGLGPSTNTWFGVQFAPGNYEDPLKYYIRPFNYDGARNADMDAEWRAGVDAEYIQHRTANVDIGSPRGIPSTYTLQGPCEQAESTRKSMGRLVDIRSRIALIRTQVNATLGQITPLLQANRLGEKANQAGQIRNVFGYPHGTVLDTNDQRTYEFPSQNIETDKIVHSLKSDLQSVASAMGLADFVISGDSSNNFSGALIKEGPMDRAMRMLQQDLIDDDVEIYERAITLAGENQLLPGAVLKDVKLDILPPPVIAHNRIQEAQADEILVRNDAMSVATMAMRHQLDPEDEWAKAKEHPSPAIANDGDTRSHQAPTDGKETSRAVPSGKEPGPDVNPQKAED